MKKIGIIGASGQVGTEVALHLALYSDVQPVALVRSRLSGAILRRLQIETRILDVSKNAGENLVKDLDLIVDFSVPDASVERIKKHYKDSILYSLSNSGPNVPFVFVSSINAFGMNSRFNKAKGYIFPNTTYALTKRYGENIAYQQGRKFKKSIFVLRLGHVHGLLQKVSHETKQLARKPYKQFIYPCTPSYTIFCFSIAEAIRNISLGLEKPGTYTAISNPAWSWAELLNYYADKPGSLPVKLVAIKSNGFFENWVNFQGLKRVLLKYRETIRANILWRFPTLEERLKSSLYKQRASDEVANFQRLFVYQDTSIHEGVFPGARLQSISDSRITMKQPTEKIAEILNSVNSGINK